MESLKERPYQLDGLDARARAAVLTALTVVASQLEGMPLARRCHSAKAHAETGALTGSDLETAIACLETLYDAAYGDDDDADDAPLPRTYRSRLAFLDAIKELKAMRSCCDTSI